MVSLSVEGKQLAIEQNVPLNVGGFSFLSLGKINFDFIRSIKVLVTPESKSAFSYPDLTYMDRSGIAVLLDATINISGLYVRTGKISVLGNDDTYYNCTFVADGGVKDAMAAYDWRDAISLDRLDDLYPDTAWGNLSSAAQYNLFLFGLLPASQNVGFFWDISASRGYNWPYNNYTLNAAYHFWKIQPFDARTGQSLGYRIAGALHNVLHALGWDTGSDNDFHVKVLDSDGDWQHFQNSELYEELFDLMTPTYVWETNYNTSTYFVKPREETGSILIYGSTMGQQDPEPELEEIPNADMKVFAGLDMWQTLVLLSKYLCFDIRVKKDYIEIVPLTNIDQLASFDLSGKITSIKKTDYVLKGFERYNQISFDLDSKASESEGIIEMFQDRASLGSEKKKVADINVRVPYHFDDRLEMTQDKNSGGSPIIYEADGTITESEVYFENVLGDSYISASSAYNFGSAKGSKFYKPTTEWQKVDDTINDPLVLEVEADLSISDVIDISDSRKVRSLGLAGEYYVEPFEWVEGSLTKLTLIKLP